MRKLPFFFLALVAVTVAACSGAIDDDETAKVCAAPPEAGVTTRTDVLRLDVVDLGELARQRPVTFASLGMNLDGRCSTSDPSTHACARVAGASNAMHVDGDGGIDNSFGRTLFPLLVPFDESGPSASASGTSFLAFEGDGRATLYLGARTNHVRAVIPLTSVRLAADTEGFTMLAAIAPRDALAQSIRTRANALLGDPSTEACAGSALESVIATIQEAADIPLVAGADPSATCDGISIGLRFRATPAASPPPLLPTCAEQIAEEQLAKDAGS